MSPASRLAALRAKYPRWTIERAPGNLIGYTATWGRCQIYSPHLTGLEAKLDEQRRD